jgi:hypothetical protein
MMLFNNVLKVVVAALLLHYDCFATFYEHALQRVFEELALFGGTLSHIMLANSHCAKKNKLPLQNEQTTSSHEQAFIECILRRCLNLIAGTKCRVPEIRFQKIMENQNVKKREIS